MNEIYSHTTLRGFAACGVVGCHTTMVYHASSYAPATDFFRSCFTLVDLFFVLSGFILFARYGAMLKDSAFWPAWRRFQLLRMIRIYPNYIAWLAISMGVATAIAANDGTMQVGLFGFRFFSFLLHAAMLQGLSGNITWNLPLWSIGVEVAAYLVFPLLLLVRHRLRGFDALAGTAALAGLGFLWLTSSLDAITGPFSVLRCLSGFSLGMVLVSLQPRLVRQSRRTLSLLQVTATGAAVTAIAWHADLVAVMAFAALVAVTAPDVGVLPGFLRRAPLHRLGQISFSLYLAHWPVLDAYLEFAGGADRRLGMTVFGDWLVMTVFVLFVSLLAAELSYRLWETPTRSWLTARIPGPGRPASQVNPQQLEVS